MRIGLLGTGPWARLAHAPGLAAHQRVDFAGVWGRNPAKAAELASEYGVATYDDVDDLFADVEAVAIALPPAVQGPLALRAAQAGKHLFLDKPVALTAAESGEIARTLSSAGLHSVVYFTRRFLPSLAGFLTEAAAEGGWVEARVDHAGTIYDEGNPFGESPWRREMGGLWDVGPHAVALVVPVLGPVAEVSAMVAPHDMTHLMLRHTTGAVSKITLSVDVPPAAAREDAVLFGEAGIRSIPNPDWDPILAYGTALDALLAGDTTMDAAFGTSVTAVLEAAAESASGGRVVTVAVR
ncbi:Gfo/Idh/MocA family oxidoreductase [Actinoplanes sp. NBRC 103695]|uniref:Gfo/Idh/MocA family protein n=1 Tax=Actinoplanes sp. NBRC 103695 TaxID=3032202 RepID=UPI0024A1A607|nr:Gfo/Idh/MocA family oxidoreductase [Actinoplanes sp. NBRC 103695]GLY98894.1 oxidoreductase [Actinoplanes sp. NBRC 103695]